MTVREKMAELREQALRMGTLSEAILSKALRAVFERDEELAREVARDDLEIDRIDVAVDVTVLRVLALQAPKADDLRAVIAIKSMATDLERVGDLSRNIAKSAQRLARRAEIALPADLERVARAAQRQLRGSLDAFSESDTAQARRVLEMDDEVDEMQDQVVAMAIEKIGQRPEIAPQEVDVILIAESLERVGDHATNVAESVILLEEAEIVKHAEKLGSTA
jgi:phosphate transport system protein